MMNIKITGWFLRISLSLGMLSVVADRFSFWPKDVSARGNWDAFVKYTATLNTYFPGSLIPVLGGFATFLEVSLAILLLIPYKTPLFAKITCGLLLIFGLSMTLNLGNKASLDYFVFATSAAAFALSAFTEAKAEKTLR